jgi:hypothetical protein
VANVREFFAPQEYTFTEDNSIWRDIDTPGECLLQAVNPATVIKYRPLNPAGARDAYATSLNGRALLLGAGKWWVNLPVIGTVAASRSLFLLDWRLYGSSADFLSSAPLPGVTPAAPTTVLVAAAASTPILAASATRARYVICNTDPANAVYLGFGGNAAVVGSGVMIGPLGTFQVDPSDGFGPLEVEGRADTADVTVSVQAWD